jgi:hypothetical protein
VEDVGTRYVVISRPTDPAKNAVPGEDVGVSFADNFIPNPKDEHTCQKKGKVETDKPGKRDGNHGLARE